MAFLSLLCRFIGHQRSRRHAKINADTGNWESSCVRCGVPMTRRDHHDWISADD